MNRRWWRTAAIFLTLPAFAAPNSGVIQVTGIHSWTHPEFTRVLFDTTGPFEVRSERVYNPDRIFFDVSHARALIDGHRYATRIINDALIKRVRVAETTPGTTRIVFDLNVPSTFKLIRLDHPDRMVIEIRAARAAVLPPVPVAKPAPPPAAIARNASPAPTPMPYLPSASTAGVYSAVYSGAPRAGVFHRVFPYPPRPSAPQFAGLMTYDLPPQIFDPAPLPTAYIPENAFRLWQIRPKKTFAVRPPSLSAPAPVVVASAPLAPAPATAPRPVPYDATPRASENATRSLTRALGLKINRIVIDAGHGGHDDGTIGPNGVLEKDVVLDVALRLSKLVQSRMGAEVVLTRSDDTFIPLQERTAIANARKADLFLSIHANSSPASSVAGTETFLLNFNSAPGAMEVAARENAGSDKSVGDLRDLIQSITLNDKIAESEAFAQNIQNSLFALASKSNVAAKNRGVKRAPFVVLIGAGMPSVLTEIGFLSNARDEANLSKPDYRQKVAEALYKGISQYAGSLSHFEVANAGSSAGN